MEYHPLDYAIKIVRLCVPLQFLVLGVLLDPPPLYSLVHSADPPCHRLLEVVPGPWTHLHH